MGPDIEEDETININSEVRRTLRVRGEDIKVLQDNEKHTIRIIISELRYSIII